MLIKSVIKQACLLMSLLVFVGTASAIPVGSFGNLNNWVTGASRIAGGGGDYAGVDAVAALIGDDLTDGAININESTSFKLDFAGGILNGSGVDFVIFDGRFSSDSVYIEVNGLEQLVSANSFVDSGLDLVLKNTALPFDLFGASLDLTSWGVATGEYIYSLNIRGVSQSDIMGVSGLGGQVSIPEPAVALLMATGLLGIAFARRKTAKV